MSFRRRTLIMTLPAVAAIKGTWLGFLIASRPARAAISPTDRLLALLPHRAEAIIIGQAYAATTPEAIGPHLVAEFDPIATAPADRMRALLRQRRREDFREGHTVTVNGWNLSVTEARLCALAWYANHGQALS